MTSKAILTCLKPRRGHKIEIPCHFKMKAFKYLCKAYGIEDKLAKVIDLNHPIFNQDCKHTYDVDDAQMFENNMRKRFK